MLDVLDELSGDYHVVMQKENHGPRQIFEEPEVWQELPDYFYITDPDIGLNHDMPDDYEDFLWDIIYEYKVFKAGPVLNLTITRPNILDIPIMVAGKETTTRNIELDYYKNELLLSMHADLYPPAYAALIDTTFCLCRKQNIQHGALSAIRCGYPYTAEHYGWWVDPPIPKEEYDFYKEAVKSSQWSSTEATKRGENYVK
jgi:hypothetical protein